MSFISKAAQKHLQKIQLIKLYIIAYFNNSALITAFYCNYVLISEWNFMEQYCVITRKRTSLVTATRILRL